MEESVKKELVLTKFGRGNYKAFRLSTSDHSNYTYHTELPWQVRVMKKVYCNDSKE